MSLRVVKNYPSLSISHEGKLFRIQDGVTREIVPRSPRGREVFALTHPGVKSRTINRLRLVYEAFIGDLEKGYVVVPIDRNYKNVELSNLIVAYGAKNEHNRDYTVDHDYLNSIDSHEKAYILGLMYSDGCVSPIVNTISYVSEDHDMVNFFKNAVKCTRELIPNSVSPKCLNVIFASTKMKADLIRLGCIPQKSLILEFPTFDQVPYEFMWSFIFGYFDGDGCISGTNQKQVKFISSTRFCEGLVTFLQSHLIRTCKISRDKNHSIHTAYFRITYGEGILRLKDFMYKNAPFILKRKHSRF